MSKKIKVLWVTHDFPPRRSSGIYRPIKIYKYIDKNRYSIDFLTQSMFFENGTIDESLIQELNPCPRIYRTPNIVMDNLVSYCAKKIRKTKNTREGFKAEFPSSTQTSTSQNNNKLIKWLYKLWMSIVYFPDQFFVWGWLTAIKALFLHMKNDYDLIYTTSHPQSCHLAGFVLRSLGVKWVADYRDGGILVHTYLLSREYRKGAIRMAVESRYQKAVLLNADHVIAHSQLLKEAFVREFTVNPDKISNISNGYDESDFHPDWVMSRQDILKQNNEIHLLHMGVWYLSQEEIRKVVVKLNELASNLATIGIQLIFHALGSDIFPPTLPKDQKPSFEYKFHAVLPHNQVIGYLLEADAYLMSSIYTVPIPGILPGKLWEYLRGGKPIILLGDKDEAWEIIQESSSGIYMDIGNNEPVPVDRLMELIDSFVDKSALIDKYSWKARAQAFDTIFSNLQVNLIYNERNDRKNVG